MLKINLLTDDVQRALKNLAGRVSDLTPALKAIGTDLVHSTQQRFVEGRGPDGMPWAPNKPSTIARKGHAKPLIGETRLLSEQIHWELRGQNTVFVFSAMEYAAIQQFGAKQGQSGRTRRGAPIPWGDIPARPFFGLSDDDQANIERTIREHLQP